MAKRKSIIVTSGHEGKRWRLTISGADHEARKSIVHAVMALQSKGFQIVNGASPFGDIDEPRRKAKKAKQAEAAGSNEGGNHGQAQELAL